MLAPLQLYLCCKTRFVAAEKSSEMQILFQFVKGDKFDTSSKFSTEGKFQKQRIQVPPPNKEHSNYLSADTEEHPGIKILLPLALSCVT